jgi:hypothetical protein
MAARRQSRRRRQGRILAELQQNLRPVARPNLLVLLWRWRYELGLLMGLPAVIILLMTQVSWVWSLTGLSVVAATFANWRDARSWLLAHARCVLTAHRVRTGCAQAWIHSRYGKLPVVLLTSPKPFGERVHLWCRAGICLEDFESAREILRSACWARDVHLTASTRYSHLVILDVIRRETIPAATGMVAAPPCAICGSPSARIELVAPGQLPADWDQWNDERQGAFQRRRDPGRWHLLFDGVTAGNGWVGDPIGDDQADRIAEAFRQPWAYVQVRTAGFEDDAGFCGECEAPYCHRHWQVSDSGVGHCPYGHGKGHDPLR